MSVQNTFLLCGHVLSINFWATYVTFICIWCKAIFFCFALQLVNFPLAPVRVDADSALYSLYDTHWSEILGGSECWEPLYHNQVSFRRTPELFPKTPSPPFSQWIVLIFHLLPPSFHTFASICTFSKNERFFFFTFWEVERAKLRSPFMFFLFQSEWWDHSSLMTFFPFLFVLQLGISSHENATPVKLIHNSAGHLNGPARTIGASLIGYLGESHCLFLSGFFVVMV